MHEILAHLPAAAIVLDLGCGRGSFPRDATGASVVRVDYDAQPIGPSEIMVRADAARLPFRNSTVHAVIATHSFEHFADLDGALAEIRRVIRPDGALFVSVPDATTLTDRLYRWCNGWWSPNPVKAADELGAAIAAVTGLAHVATRTLCSSLSFLNRHNAPKPRPRRLLLLGGGATWTLLLYTWLSRRIDRFLKTRTSIYGWALYFGDIRVPIDTTIRENVCVRCGSAFLAEELPDAGSVFTRLGVACSRARSVRL